MASSGIDRDASRLFLDSLFGIPVDDGFRFLICSKKNFAGKWFDDVSKGVDEAHRLAKSTDVYVGVGIREQAPTEGRGDADGVGGIVALWADIDVAHEAHKKQNLPPDYDAATSFVDSVFGNVKPSFLIDSGHGLQAWWLLDEPWVFETDEDRQRAYTLSQRFSATLKVSAESKGWAIDSVFDLTRVLRVPGTTNRKISGKPKPVRILHADPSRSWSIDDIEGVVVAQEFMPTSFGGPQPVEAVGVLNLRHNAQPPMEKFAAIMQNIDGFAESWENKRPDFVDKSPSSYDMSLATFAAQCGWEDQEIADLLIAHRAKHRHDMKETRRGDLRLDYYQRTISRAREGIGQQATTTNLNKGFSAAPTAAGVEVTSEEKSRILKDASYVFGVPIDRFVQYGDGEDASYLLELRTGETVTIGSAKNLQNQKTWASKLFPISRKLFEPLKPRGWVTLINSLGLIVDIEDNPESNRHAQITDLLSAYLQSSITENSDEMMSSIRSSAPFIRDGMVHISRVGFTQWSKATQTEKIILDDVWGTLRRMNFVQQTVSGTLSGKNYTRRYWVSSIDDCGEPLGLTGTTTRKQESKNADIQSHS